MTFLDYLSAQLSRPKDPSKGDFVADFAYDAIHDNTPLPANASYAEWKNYLKSSGAIPEAISSFEIAWAEYQSLNQ